MPRSTFWRWVIALALLGAGLRIGYVLLTAQTPIINDGWYHHRGANLLADGDGYISPSHPLSLIHI